MPTFIILIRPSPLPRPQWCIYLNKELHHCLKENSLFYMWTQCQVILLTFVGFRKNSVKMFELIALITSFWSHDDFKIKIDNHLWIDKNVQIVSHENLTAINVKMAELRRSQCAPPGCEGAKGPGSHKGESPPKELLSKSFFPHFSWKKYLFFAEWSK